MGFKNFNSAPHIPKRKISSPTFSYFEKKTNQNLGKGQLPYFPSAEMPLPTVKLPITDRRYNSRMKLKQKQKNKTRKQSEPAHLRQGNIVHQVATPSSVLQRFLLCPIESNGNENFKVIQNPGFLPDHPQN